MNKYIVVVLLLSLASCRNAEQNTVAGTDSTAVIQESTPQDVKLENANIQNIYTSYIVLKDALVNAKFEDAQKASESLSAALNAHKGCETTALIADKIKSAKTLIDQRKEFTFLSADIIPLVKNATVEKGTVYVQRCPMANNGDGGEWLASEKNIRNPYYGDEMMDCGAIIEEIKVK